MPRIEYSAKDLVIAPYALIDKEVFQSGLFDTGNAVVNRAFYQAINRLVEKIPDYHAYCLIPSGEKSIIGFFSFSQSKDFEIEGGYDFVKSYEYAKIDWFGVNKRYQRSNGQPGYGRHLMYHALKQLVSVFPKTELVCLEAKRSAILAYQNYGFVEIPETDVAGEYGGVDMLMPVEIVNQYLAAYEKALLV
jgi:ribosomal protein S18 acetylase RimI-like enzyme